MKKAQRHSESVQRSVDETEESPILLLDVNLGNKVERLTLNSGDEARLEEVAQ